MKWVHPDGWTVETVTLSDTRPPRRPGDPPSHVGPRDYFRVTRLGRRFGYVPSLEALHAMAEREAWDAGLLRQVPTHVVLDHYGKVYSHGADGEPFDREAAEKFAAHRNASAREGCQHGYRVQVLGEVN